MLHNTPYQLSATLAAERPFAHILTQTYTLIDGLDKKLREEMAKTIERFAVDPTDAIVWRAESAIENQTTLSLLVGVCAILSKVAALEDAPLAFAEFTKRYTGYVISWAHHGETSSSGFSNLASRATLAATARLFGSFGIASEIERAINNDIEESKKRIIVSKFVD